MNESENNGHDLTKLPPPNPLRYPTLYDLYFVFTKKMKLILALGIGLAFLSVVGACLFRNPTLFMYPLHASCNVTWYVTNIMHFTLKSNQRIRKSLIDQ